MRTRAQKAFDDTINDPQRLGVALSESIAEGDWRLSSCSATAGAR